MLDPITANRMGRDHQRELLQQAERARALRAARSIGENGDQPGFRTRIQGMVGHMLGTRGSDKPGSVPEEDTKAA